MGSLSQNRIELVSSFKEHVQETAIVDGGRMVSWTINQSQLIRELLGLSIIPEGLGKPVLVVAEEANPEIRLPDIDAVSLHPSSQGANEVIEPATMQKRQRSVRLVVARITRFRNDTILKLLTRGSWNIYRIYSIIFMSKLSQRESSFHVTSFASRK